MGSLKGVELKKRLKKKGELNLLPTAQCGILATKHTKEGPLSTPKKGSLAFFGWQLQL